MAGRFAGHTVRKPSRPTCVRNGTLDCQQDATFQMAGHRLSVAGEADEGDGNEKTCEKNAAARVLARAGVSVRSPSGLGR